MVKKFNFESMRRCKLYIKNKGGHIKQYFKIRAVNRVGFFLMEKN